MAYFADGGGGDSGGASVGGGGAEIVGVVGGLTASQLRDRVQELQEIADGRLAELKANKDRKIEMATQMCDLQAVANAPPKEDEVRKSRLFQDLEARLSMADQQVPRASRAAAAGSSLLLHHLLQSGGEPSAALAAPPRASLLPPPFPCAHTC